ncbi:MAG: DUF5050 domain-containing protein [Ruminococcus sp.]|jgi:hypothetical protein|nr:DUF5050 domain-containing protein [Ruminococcus sp.]
MKKILTILAAMLILAGCGASKTPAESFTPAETATAASFLAESVPETTTATPTETANGDFPAGFPVPEGVTRTLREDGYLIYYTDITKGDSRLNEIVAVNLETLETIDVYATEVNLAAKPGDENFSGQRFLTKNFRLESDGYVYFYVLTDYDTDGFHKRQTFRKNLKTRGIEEHGFETSDKPYAEYTSGEAETLYQSGVRSVKLDIPVPESGANVVITNTADWERILNAPPPEDGITLMTGFGQYVCYRYERKEGNYITSGIGYVDVLKRLKYTIQEIQTRDPKSYTDSMDAMLSSNLPRIIPNTFRYDNGELYYYVYGSYSDENWGDNYPHDDGYHMRSIMVYNFETTWINLGMWEDSYETPYSLSPEPPPLPSEIPEKPIETYDFKVSEIEYIAAANSDASGQFAFDEDYIYYKNINDNGNLYKKHFGAEDAGVKLADANEHGYLYGICVYGDEVFFATHYYDTEPDGTDGHGGPTIYAVKKDGSSAEPKEVLSGAGDDFFIYDGVLYFTGGEYSSYDGLNSLPYDADSGKPLDGSLRENIAPFAMQMSVADGMITYYDGANINVYDITAGSVAAAISQDTISIDSMFRFGDYIIYHYEYGAESRLYSVLSAVNFKTREETQIDMKWIERNKEAEGGSYIPASFNLFEGQIYYNTYWDEKDGGYHQKTLQGFSLDEKKVMLGSWDESLIPYRTTKPECALFSCPDGIYSYAPDGNLVKFEFASP